MTVEMINGKPYVQKEDGSWEEVRFSDSQAPATDGIVEELKRKGTKQKHTTRNVLIGTAVGVGLLAGGVSTFAIISHGKTPLAHLTGQSSSQATLAGNYYSKDGSKVQITGDVIDLYLVNTTVAPLLNSLASMTSSADAQELASLGKYAPSVPEQAIAPSAFLYQYEGSVDTKNSNFNFQASTPASFQGNETTWGSFSGTITGGGTHLQQVVYSLSGTSLTLVIEGSTYKFYKTGTSNASQYESSFSSNMALLSSYASACSSYTSAYLSFASAEVTATSESGSASLSSMFASEGAGYSSSPALSSAPAPAENNNNTAGTDESSVSSSD